MPAAAACLVERTIRDTDGRLHHVTVNLAESPLTWLHARGKLSDRQYIAGDLLRRDWERAAMGAQITMRWDPTPVARGRRGGADTPDPTLAQIGAKDRLRAAMQAAGPGLSDVLWRVACAGEGLGAAEKALGWPGRAGKLVLGFALDRVADFYRIAG